MDNRIEKAVGFHKQGYNCCQSVICAYCDLFGLDEEAAFKVSEGFGGGMGGMRDGTCGAVTGLYMLAGMKNSSGDLEKGKTKADTYALVKKLREDFVEMNTSVICSDLLGLAGKPKLRSCDGCIEDACGLVEKYLLSGEGKEENL